MDGDFDQLYSNFSFFAHFKHLFIIPSPIGDLAVSSKKMLAIVYEFPGSTENDKAS